MLTSAGRREDADRCRKLGISASLSKPIKQSELFDVIINVIGESATERTRRSQRRRKSSHAQGKLRILVAEDNEINQLVARRIFEKLGHKVTVVGNGREALSAVQSGEFDLVAMDVQMPEMDGFETMQVIRQNPTFRRLPLVALTAKAMKGDREKCLEAGASDYLAKPVNTEQLLSVLRMWLHR